jgi:uncharacterized membrane protein
MREALLWIALAFCLFFGAATASVAAQYGIDIFTVISFLIIVMLMLAVLGAIRNPPRK